MNAQPRSFLFGFCSLILVLALLAAWRPAAAAVEPVTQIFRSMGAYDGWVLESSEFSSVGGTMNATGTTFNLGDDAGNRQYRAILHFSTGSIPDTATITGVTLTIERAGVVGTNPFTKLGLLRLDIRKPFFGPAVTLAPSDFQAPATKLNAGVFSSTPISGGSAYLATLPSTSFPYINKTGITQFRLRFTLDDNNNHVADYMKFLSGNWSAVSDRPELEVEYIP